MRRAMVFVTSLSACFICCYPAVAETDTQFILNSFPQCNSKPIFSPYAAGALSGSEAKQRAEWFARLKPIAGAPCVAPAEHGLVFCGTLVCRHITLD
jgi:hypothetical protein